MSEAYLGILSNIIRETMNRSKIGPTKALTDCRRGQKNWETDRERDQHQ
jgi:hypothetical protein